MQKQLLVAAGLALAATFAGQAPAQAAADGPWCASTYNSGGTKACYFLTFQQCQASISGIGGQCTPNDAYGAQAHYVVPLEQTYVVQRRPRLRYYYYD